MNEEGGIYKEIFHLNWGHKYGFSKGEKVIKVTFFKSCHAPGSFFMRLGALG